ncbi:MAG TPA: BamA/TamA family outer membrane protein [Terriglobales bacterium]|nr:BamA/TamA family outer membrane protein [Terriglobales bacterium]
MSRQTQNNASTQKLLVLWVALAACVVLTSTTSGQQQPSVIEKATKGAGDSQQPGIPSGETEKRPETQITSRDKKKSDKKSSWIVAPLPISSPAVGTGIVPVLGYIFPFSKNDTVSPPSVIGMAGLVTNNGSRSFGAYSDLFMKEDTFRITAVYARGNLNYDLYGIGLIAGNEGRKLPLKQTGQVFRGELLRRVAWGFFLGARFWTGSSEILRNGTSDASYIPPDIGLQTELRALGLRVNRDTTPNRFYPTRGMSLNFTSDFFSQDLGSKYSFQAYRFTFNKYGSLSKKQVLAYNLFVCGTGGKPPFYGNCIYGTNNELRGYTAGRYLDRYMYATQLEYRLTLPKRFGVVAFAGIGEVLPGGSQLLRIREILPGGGAGARFQLSKPYGVNLRADVARGKDTWTWSMGVGEAF